MLNQAQYSPVLHFLSTIFDPFGRKTAESFSDFALKQPIFGKTLRHTLFCALFVHLIYTNLHSNTPFSAKLYAKTIRAHFFFEITALRVSRKWFFSTQAKPAVSPGICSATRPCGKEEE